MIKKSGVVLFAVGSLLAAYFVKCRFDIDIIKDISFRSVPPFKFLQNREPFRILTARSTGEPLLADDFDGKGIRNNWSALWMREPGKVSWSIATGGVGKTHAMRIVSYSSRDWSLPHHARVKVMPGDMFSYGVAVRTEDTVRVVVGITLLNEDHRVVAWRYAAEPVESQRHWRRIQRSFVVPETVRFIQFRVTGSGMGTVWIDDVALLQQELQSADRESG